MYISFCFLAAENKVSKSELAKKIQHQEFTREIEALRKENVELKKTKEIHSSLKKDYLILKEKLEIIELKYMASKRTVKLKDSEVKDLKKEIWKLRKQSSSGQAEHKQNNQSDNMENNEDDDDVEVLEYVQSSNDKIKQLKKNKNISND